MEHYAPSGLIPYLALGLWVPISLSAFAALGVTRGALVTMFGGMLFLPEYAAFDAPLIPPIGKNELSALTAFVGCLLFAPGRLRAARPGRGIDWLILLLIAASVMTVVTNREPLVTGVVVRPALTNHDIFSWGIREILQIGLPFLVGRAVIRDARDLRALYRVLIGFALAYSLLMLLEMRLSPQLHNWVYGYHIIGDFSQVRRWGGFRPTVFMTHGLATGMFALVAAVAAFAYSRAAARLHFVPTIAWAVYLLAILLLCKSTGAIVLGALLIPAILWSRPRTQMRFAVLLGALCFAYPAMRITGLTPDATALAAAQKLSGERAQSLEFRFHNEQMLSSHAARKIWFGWGGFSRNHVFDENGKDITITDGYWILQLGMRGAVGLFCTFGLLLFPVLRAFRSVGRIPDRGDRLLFAGLGLILTAYTFDLLPNGLYNQIPFFYAGAVLRLSRELPEAPA